MLGNHIYKQRKIRNIKIMGKKCAIDAQFYELLWIIHLTQISHILPTFISDEESWMWNFENRPSTSNLTT